MRTALLLSGGMDSLSIAWWRRPDVAITLDYGQVAAPAEIEASRQVCRELDIEHHVLDVDCSALGSGDMAGAPASALAPATEWWPYRNQLLVTLAAMKAIGLGVRHLLIGTVASDDAHADGTRGFVDRLSALLAMQEGGMTLEAPAIELTTVGLIRVAGVPPPFLAWAHSCHRATVACGACRGCNKYFEVLHDIEAGLA